MKALVVTASKHGSTHEVGERIAMALAGAAPEAITVTTVHLDHDKAPSVDVGMFDVAILGSALYFGKWLSEARQFTEEHITALTKMPVWLFSVGPLGTPPHPDVEHAGNLDEIIQETKARGYVVFPGALDRDALGFAERAMATALRAPNGDFRDWHRIEEWARMIADDVRLASAPH